LENEVLDARFSRLFSFAKDKLQSVKYFLHKDSMLENFHLPLSVEAHAELSNLKNFLSDVHLRDSANDSWVLKLGHGGFKPSKIYKHAFDHFETHQPSCWIWKSKCTSKHKFFAWLILHDRINTNDMLLRRHWHVTDIIIAFYVMQVLLRTGEICSSIALSVDSLDPC
jgi:hypothetical protein